MSGKVFGVDLETYVQKQRVEVPRIVVHAIEFLNKNNAHLEEGLFRIPGNTLKIGVLKKQFDSDHNVDLFKHKDLDVHTVACLLKMYLRELPTPAILPRFYSTYMKVYQNPDPRQRLINFRKLIMGLPKSHRSILLTILSYLNLVSQNQHTNKMSTLNLALIFAPNLMRSEKETLTSIMEDADKVAGTLQLLIQEVDYLTTGNPPAWFATAGGSPLSRAKSISSPAFPNNRSLPREDSISDVFINALNNNNNNHSIAAVEKALEASAKAEGTSLPTAVASSVALDHQVHASLPVLSAVPLTASLEASQGGTLPPINETEETALQEIKASPADIGEKAAEATPPPASNGEAPPSGDNSNAYKRLSKTPEGTRSTLRSSLDNDEPVAAPKQPRLFSFLRSSSDTKLDALVGPDERVIATSVKNMKALRASSDFTHNDKNRRRLELMTNSPKSKGFNSHQDLKSFTVMG